MRGWNKRLFKFIRANCYIETNEFEEAEIEEIINFSENKNLTEKESLDIFKLLGINVVQYNEFIAACDAGSQSVPNCRFLWLV